ncbi:GFA family protein [Variovorax sp. RT4R15]|uniref:GFA family protein n=1 Tax=Variovorax sp. RT4R15 TaxID=3443737 RepID=UPI003F460E75
MLKTYHGSCHCGAVRFEAELDLTQSTYRCNCSICRRTRFWPAVARPEGFRLLTGEADLTKYLFNTRKNEHYFCRHCGVRAFGVGTETPIGLMYGVNLGCLEDASDEELANAPVTYVDGRSDNWANAPEFFRHL